ncbi:N-acetyltransferase [Parasynechococcus sp.]|uniref:N-acetyltransferase n=1 Tax=Parasynechococcus sp. TaxID=3101203 RepID=UPI003703905C
MLPFLQQSSTPNLPDGFRIETSERPSPAQLNGLLQACGESTHDEERWQLALERSVWHLSILDTSNGELVGFVRATSDLALNANLWNLCARPGADQAQLLAVLVHRSLHMLRRDLPGCSLSISAPADTVEALEKQGFVIDPNGIRAMGLPLQTP